MNTKCIPYLLLVPFLFQFPLPAAATTLELSGITDEYRLDDGNGTTAADSAGGIPASLQAFGTGNSQWITGIFGGAVDYTNENAYIITNSPLAAGGANQFSVSFWARLDSIPNSNDSVLMTPQGDNWITFNPSANTNGSGLRGIGIGPVRDANEPLVDVWENYVVTFNRTTSTVTVYRDGVLSNSGTVALPSLTADWVFGHNQGPGNTNGSWHGALDEIQVYNRILSPTEVSQLASRPPQPGLTAHLVVPAQNFGSQPTGQYARASTTFFVDPAHTTWLAWNRFPDLRAESNTGTLFLGADTPEVDDYFNLTVTNPLGQQMTIAMDQNGPLGAPFGQQSVIFGAAGAAPEVLRGDNFLSPTIFNETGAFNSLFTVAGNYEFDFSFQNIGGNTGYPNVYLLAESVPEPGTLVLVALGLLASIPVARKRLRIRATTSN